MTQQIPFESSPEPASTPLPARFTVGSTMRHVIIMTLTGSIGLVAIFLVDFLSLMYISFLKDERLTAGVGYATTVMLFAISINVGMMIAGSALVARHLGAGDREAARQVSGSAVVLVSAIAVIVTGVLLLLTPWFLDFLGAVGVSREVALRFLWIALPSNALMAFGMIQSGTLRAVGDANRSMMVTLLGGLTTALLDPLFIFIFKMGTDGAAVATVISRVIFCAVGWYGVNHIHNLMARPSWTRLKRDIRPLLAIALPAVATNLASPIAASFILSVIKQFGHEAVAANAIIDRLIPVLFGVIFALSSSIGPILAQNLGAGRLDRVHQALRDALVFAMLYSFLAWLVLALGRHQVTQLFGATEKTAAYVAFFCLYGTAAWVFLGFLFVANAAFNNLGFPLYSTFFNWGRATLGTMPFAVLGGRYYGYEGVVLAIIGGCALFGIASSLTAFRVVKAMAEKRRSVSL